MPRAGGQVVEPATQQEVWVAEQHRKMSQKKDKYRAVLKLHV